MTRERNFQIHNDRMGEQMLNFWTVIISMILIALSFVLWPLLRHKPRHIAMAVALLFIFPIVALLLAFFF